MKKRLELVDTIRGLAIVSMIGYHACWIMCFFGILISKELLNSDAFNIWQKSICFTFIIISGFAFNLSKRRLRNGIVTLSIGVIITLLSIIFLYEARDIFGVLWLIGFCTLMMIPVDKLIGKALLRKKIISFIIIIICILLYVVTRNINVGYINMLDGSIIRLPKYLYTNLFMTFLGFMMPTFYSVDYFSVIPWSFLYIAGYCLYKVICGNKLEEKVLVHGIPFLSKWVDIHY